MPISPRLWAMPTSLRSASTHSSTGRYNARIARISGSHSGIVGLPLRETAQLIEDWVEV